MLSRKDSPRGRLLEQYVCVRIIRMDGVDLGLFDFDRHNTLYFFALNAEEQIYLRYGGRTAESPTSHLDLESLELALARGLEQHELYQAGAFEPPPRAEPFFPRQIESLREREMNRGRCVECHLIADYLAQDLESVGLLDKTRVMYASPDPGVVGVHFDVPKGLEVERSEGPAAAAGLEPGDRVVAVEGVPVFTFGDFQYQYDKLQRRAQSLRIAVDRAGNRAEEVVDLEVELPQEWWVSDLFFRYWSVEPLLYFSSDALTDIEKRDFGLDPQGFACRVRFVEAVAAAFEHHGLAPGDVVFAVDGVQTSELTTNCEVFLKLDNVAGEESRLGVLREGERIEVVLRSGAQRFRK